MITFINGILQNYFGNLQIKVRKCCNAKKNDNKNALRSKREVESRTGNGEKGLLKAIVFLGREFALQGKCVQL